MVVLNKIKFFPNLDLKRISLNAGRVWFAALFFMAWQAVMGLMKCAKEEAKLKMDKAKVGQEGGMDATQFAEAVKKAKAKRTTQTVNLVKACCDSISASQAAGYPQQFFGRNINDGFCGVGGFTSAFLTCWTLWPSK